MTNEVFSHTIKPMQTTKDPQSINELLGRGSFREILKKAQHLNQLGKVFAQLLPDHLTGFCTVITVKHLQLIVGVSSAAALTECRFLESNLLKQLKQHAPYQIIRAIKFKIYV